MSQQQQRDNSGILFINDRKQTDKQPDYKGRCVIGGVEHWISGWIRTGAKGDFTSLAFEVKEDKPAQAPAAPVRRAAPAARPVQQRAPVTETGFDDDHIPFS